jgi:poly(A) polymerase
MRKNMKLEFNTPEGLAAIAVIEAIRAAGGQAFIVGGAVRDVILGMEPKDVDIATDFTPDMVTHALFKNRVKLVGKSFGVALVNMMGHDIEVATFRKDGVYTDGRRPDSVEFSKSAEEDSRRRDLTMNALYFDPITSEVIDFHGGLGDIENGIIRTVGLPEMRFAEDFLRMLRVARFASRFNFSVDKKVVSVIKRMASNVNSISGERIFMEVDKMITRTPVESMELMRRLGLLEHILPEVEDMIGVEQPPHHHPEGCVWTHTLLVLENMDTPAPSELAWSALLHDIGKPPTKGVNSNGNICFHGHAKESTEMAKDILKRRMRCSNDFTNNVCTIIANHTKLAFSCKGESIKIDKIRRHMARETIDLELALCRLDALGKGASCNLDNYRKLMEFREQFQNEPAVPPPLVTGNDIIEAGIPRGPEIGTMLRKIQDMQLQGDIGTREEALSFVKSSM